MDYPRSSNRGALGCCDCLALTFDAVAPDDAVSEALEHRSERDQDVIRLRFTLNDEKAWAWMKWARSMA